MADQLGLTVTEIKPVGLESSAGSTPLRLRVQGGPEQFVFAKLYTEGHVRADRWYKLGRAILYGTMEEIEILHGMMLTRAPVLRPLSAVRRHRACPVPVTKPG